jgi:hypothetical protein
MKFSKILKRKQEEWQSSFLGEKFLRYKALKQQLKQISGEKEQGGETSGMASLVCRSTPGAAALTPCMCFRADDKDISHAFQHTEDASATLQQHIPASQVQHRASSGGIY